MLVSLQWDRNARRVASRPAGLVHCSCSVLTGRLAQIYRLVSERGSHYVYCATEKRFVFTESKSTIQS
jgi:hypothetical protein